MMKALVTALLVATATGVSAAPASTRACDIASEYVRLIEAHRYDEVGELWADDAVFYSPRGVVIRGKAAIKAFYAKFLPTITPINRIARLAWDAQQNVCTMELETRMTRGADGEWKPDAQGAFQAAAVDRFTVSKAGKVQHMIVYLPPNDRWAADK